LNPKLFKNQIKLEYGYSNHNKYPCDECDYDAKHLNYSKRHKISQHEGVKYFCDQCSHRSKSLSHLKLHKLNVDMWTKYSFDQCLYKASDMSSLKRHITAEPICSHWAYFQTCPMVQDVPMKLPASVSPLIFLIHTYIRKLPCMEASLQTA
jgi:hypothetical protein